MATTKNWVITTSGEHSLPDIARQLTEAGFSVAQVLPAIGCIIASAPAEAATQARAIPGVADVSLDSPVGINLPDAPVTW